MNDMDMDLEDKSKPAIRFNTELIYAFLFLAIGICMIIYPGAPVYVPGPCDPDEAIGCLISDHWGTPGGITISLITGILLGISAIRNYRRNRDDGEQPGTK